MKVAILLTFLLAFSFASTFEQVKAVVKNDKCALKELEYLKPKIQNQIQRIKENPDDLIAKAELLILVQQTKEVFEQCNINKKVEPVLDDAVKAAGIGFLLASNCFKDIGAILLISDQIIQDSSKVVNDIIILIFIALLGRQSYADCQQFIHYII